MFLRNSFLLAASLTLAALSGQAQLTVDTGMAPTQMVQNLVGPGVQIFNVQVTAAPGSFGYYYSNNTELGTNQGLLLSTGQAENAIGPNNSSGLPQIGPGGVCLNCAEFDNNFPGSQLLTEAQDRNTFDATMVEFDIVPQGDSLRFSYTFASEEYLEWVNSPFNDVFGFYITGPNIGTDVNIALLPGTSQAVAINSVNHLTNTQYFFSNQNPFGQGVQFDGFTVDLAAAVGNLIPCETYHLKLIIADGSDRLYDSGVFVNRIESNPLIVLTTTAGGTDYMIEGCNNGVISFCRTIATPSAQDVVYWLGGTAVDGVDYEQIGDGIPLNLLTITIPANELCAAIPVNTFDDGIFEGEEYLTIYLGNPLCSNLEVLDTVNFFLIDRLEVNITADPSEICAGLCTVLNGTAITDGTSSFTWSPTTGMDDPSSLTPQVCPTETTTYTLTSEVASCFGEASITISVSQIQLEFEVTNDNCQNANTGSINLNVLDAIDPLSFEWTGPNDFVSADQNLTGLAPGEYCVVVTDAGGCVASGCVTVVQINELAIESETLSDFVCFPISCFGASDGAINIEITGGVPEYTYSWTGPNGFTADTQDVSGLPTGIYSVTITDAAGCTLTDTYTLLQPEPLSLVVVGEVDLLCSGAETGSAEVFASGGCTPYFYSWSHDPILDAPIALNLGSGIYTVSISDVNGCTIEGSVEIEINEPIDPVNITLESILIYPGGFNVSCPNAADGALEVTIAGGVLPYVISWSGPDGFSSSQEDLLDIACGTYLLTVTDANECVVTQTVTLSCVPQIQITFEVEPNPCLDPEAGVGTITILTTTGGHGDPYFYDWIGPEGFVASGATLTGLISGSYTVTVTDPFGCTRDFNITVGTNDAFDVTAVVENASCAGSCNGSINQTIVPPGAYNFTWNGPNGPLAATEDQVGLCA